MNNNLKWKRILLLLLLPLLTFKVVQSQNIHRLTGDRFRNAVEMYNRGLYTAADAEFTAMLNEDVPRSAFDNSEIEAYRVLCAASLRRGDIEGTVNEFAAKYPWSVRLNTIYLKLASWYFDNSEYIKAYETLRKVKKSELASGEVTDFSFKSGYCNLRVGHIDRALDDFAQILYRPVSIYTAPSQYYTAYIYYIKKDFKQAIDKFKPLVSDKRFAILSRYYILESNFMLGNHKYVVDNGEDLYNTVDKEYKAKIARMMSESFFAMNKPDDAKFYFDKYTLYSGQLTRKDIYYSGMIAYTLRNYILANESLQKLLTIDDSLAQNARYHMANAYLQLKNKQKALESFKAASENNYDPVIKEDALFNYAKLAFDLYSDISLFDKYTAEYTPSEAKSAEIKSYMATSFISKQDYKSAVEVLSQIKTPGDRQNRLMQRASFLRGLQLVDLGAYRDAVPYLEKGVELGRYNEYLAFLSQFWLTEAKYRNNQYADAVRLNTELITKGERFRGTPEYKMINFNLGYAQLRLGNYEAAMPSFEKFIKSTPASSDYYPEACMRYGDCLFMLKKYPEATEAYSMVPGTNQDIFLYSVLQKSIALGLTGNDAAKISLLKDVVSKYQGASIYPEIEYELGRTLVQSNDNTGAVASFSDIIENYKKSPSYPKALIEMGLISLNKHDINSSLNYYKRVIDEFPGSAEAQDALAGLENVYQESNRPDEYLAYIEKSGLSSAKTPAEKEHLVYNTGERQYLDSNYSSAITSLRRYITEYPQGDKLANAYFYLAESLNNSGKQEESLDAYKKVIDLGDDSFTELATLNLARISYRLENFRQAFLAYQSLEDVAKIDANKVEARLGMVNSLFMDKQYKEAINEAAKINTSTLDDEKRARLKFVTAKSRFMTGERAQAVAPLKEIAKNSATPEGAESHYLLILNAFENGNFKDVETLVFAFSDTRTPQKYWLAKSYIVLGDSYIEREDWKQARATFNSILESYKPTGAGDDISEQIRTRLNNIKDK